MCPEQRDKNNPDLALRAWPRYLQLCPKSYPKAIRWPLQGNPGQDTTQIHPRSTVWLLGHFQKNQEFRSIQLGHSSNISLTKTLS